jgi:hypothetical protein
MTEPNSISKLSLFALGLMLIVIVSCGNEDPVPSTPDPTPEGGTVSIKDVVSANYKSAVTLTVGTSSITLRSEGVPDHPSPYWGEGNSLYEEQRAGGTLNPGRIATQNYSMTIQIFPSEASSKEATSLGPIGMALNGVPIYNDREGGNVPVDEGVLGSFDRAGAHPGPGNTYHYHTTGDFTGNDNANLIGFLRDGFPIYGRKDVDGSYPSNLDLNGGHVGTTGEFNTAIYHYHASNVAYLNSRFYILKAGSYHGTKGTFTN